ncbi:hypothetical protein PsorP6_011584 [Peronosclerospora sorghi]|uniref:Uncharacterized protein n=1 Tax=Peronosclerospora sorghi TaxID=230839 RepID=A0ACC0WIH3_9STRA|nr:hypothetical protein PsorP6_011584 [Peronosclerospora sorghi]
MRAFLARFQRGESGLCSLRFRLDLPLEARCPGFAALVAHSRVTESALGIAPHRCSEPQTLMKTNMYYLYVSVFCSRSSAVYMMNSIPTLSSDPQTFVQTKIITAEDVKNPSAH